ncbi:hypothetical protein AKJ37_07770 [candidate division MSBL1 archaeon SCGC-AAA259I09]|uniref:Uncharacterized protein n=2 Tax=candidate division MSBL1 TaxID=215777 RepID=A0A133UJ83_9EURY|nr:hypothetical protein AKJ61_02235 [candidate division MSBL1 archaeon SCGC-AAA259B11]KXA94279.1 hypothetical protein AKJ37_07770 [candidate division MSBL1 archaeon SCGC-AAA259I09]
MQVRVDLQTCPCQVLLQFLPRSPLYRQILRFSRLHYKVIRKVGEEAEWAKVEERSNNSRILVTREWGELKKALKNSSKQVHPVRVGR